MEKIRYTGTDPRSTQHGDVETDTVLEVPAAAVYGYTVQPDWEPVTKAAQAVHNRAEKAEKDAVAKERAERGLEPVG